MSHWKEFTKGILKENPVLVLLLGLCPTLAVTTGVKNAIGMGIAATFVLVCSNVIISLIRSAIPKKIRIPCYIVVIATFVTLVQMTMAGYFPALNEALGIFIPLIVVNCIILGRAEAFAGRNGVFASLLDGIGMGVGFGFAVLLIGLIREVLGTWSIGGVPITEGGFQPMAVLIMAPGAFLVIATVLAVFDWLRRRAEGRLSEDIGRELARFALEKPAALRAVRLAEKQKEKEEKAGE